MQQRTAVLSVCLSLVLLAFGFAHALPASSSSSQFSVGAVQCSVVKTGSLSLYNTKTKKRQYVTIANNYTVGQQTSHADASYNDLPLLSSYKHVTKEESTTAFLSCSTGAGSYEDFDAKTGGTYHGHLSPLNGAGKKAGKDAHGNPALCTTHVVIYADEAYLAADKCYYKDDAHQVPFYFAYTPKKKGQVDFIGHTGPNGGSPVTNSDGAVYDFVPGTSAKHPAMYVHFGSSKFSDWVLQLH